MGSYLNPDLPYHFLNNSLYTHGCIFPVSMMANIYQTIHPLCTQALVSWLDLFLQLQLLGNGKTQG